MPISREGIASSGKTKEALIEFSDEEDASYEQSTISIDSDQENIAQQPPLPPPRDRSKQKIKPNNVLGKLFEQVAEKDPEVPALHYPTNVKFNKFIYYLTGWTIFILLFYYLEGYQKALLFTPFLIFFALGKINLYPADYLYKINDTNNSMTFHQVRKSIRFYNRVIGNELKDKNKNRVIILVDPNDIQLVPLVFSLIQTGQEILVLNPNECGIDSFLEWIPKLNIDAVIVSPLIYLVIQAASLFKKRQFLNIAKKVLLFTPSDRAFNLLSKNRPEWKKITKIVNVEKLQIEPEENDENLYQFDDDETVVIVNTTGTTGIPKLVHITHGMLKNQIYSFNELMRPYLIKGRQDRVINHNTVMTLCVNCMGLTAIVPPFNLASPASVNSKHYINALNVFYPRMGFCSPIVWMEVIDYCKKMNEAAGSIKEENTISPPLEVLLCGGSVAPYSLHQKLRKWASKESSEPAIFPTYGATEGLPICLTNTYELDNIYTSDSEIYSITKGYCVGKECPNITILIRNQEYVSTSNIGEIWVGGSAISPRYELDDNAMKTSKEMINGILYHKTGDIGYMDENKMLWYCGRLSHMFHIALENERKHMIAPPCIEHAFYNKYSNIRRCACVGYSPISGNDSVQLKMNEKNFTSKYNELVFKEIAIVFETFGNESISISDMEDFWRKQVLPNAPKLFTNIAIRFVQQKSLPVDRRHNSKIEMVKIATEINKNFLK
ncbi:AMP binding domain-containing protein [Naegleria gruberi]|uniref:AMP binding domain-containing protein n=1 Tax=Naegleria gruberi TaxID=5762 RepID=D2VRH5_NAEGR|nr:AMP binding domain-containing protein [Naegleria gruberi]EFC40675.1 AMP binding domain-containing protein [Naegleria gruberi]|eukprot:XP_002673419.1 AMP binding domain-containing protein [Naegleria gruberi strain NEG-M]